MAKIERGRISGLDGMTTFTSTELFEWADQIENQIQNPENQDDPRWLQCWAEKLRRLATKKEKAKSHKEKQQRRQTNLESKTKTVS